MILSDHEIAKMVLEDRQPLIMPFTTDQVQPASYDVRLGNKFRYFRKGAHIAIYPGRKAVDLTALRELDRNQDYVLHPGDLVLGATVEHFEIPVDLAARVEGKSSLGRIGLVIHSTAGWIDPGFKGNITLEISNNAPLPIVLSPGMFIGQIAFMRLSSPCARPYGTPGLGSKYQGDTDPTESQAWKERVGWPQMQERE